ncbi:MAG: tetratricopeptide repeat protein [Myxococcaceae bacterium]|nr:tetratricopeptide repeat protein [Myxococcaceae bacterium]
MTSFRSLTLRLTTTFAVALLLPCVVHAAAPVAAAGQTPKLGKYEAGLKAFNQGDFEAALKALDAAVGETADSSTLEKIHLMRAQCFAARQDFVRAEEAFARALDANPEASLDPSRVDPAVVKMLDAMRGRLSGELVMRSTPEGAQLSLDGKGIGKAPVTLIVGIGKHRLEAQWGKEPPAKAEVLVRARSQTRVEWLQTKVEVVKPLESPPLPSEAPSKIKPVPLADVRFVNEDITIDSSLEVGAGVDGIWIGRFSVHARLLPKVGLTPRLGFTLPIHENFGVPVELEVPMIFLPQQNPSLAVGVGLGAGIEWTPRPWFGLCWLAGFRHYAQYPDRLDLTRFTMSLGLRLKVP